MCLAGMAVLGVAQGKVQYNEIVTINNHRRYC